MNKKLGILFIAVCATAAQVHGQSPTPTPAPVAAPITVVIDSVQTSFGKKNVTATSQFGHQVGGSGPIDSDKVFIFYHLTGVQSPHTTHPCYEPRDSTISLQEIDLLEDGVRVAFQLPCPYPTGGFDPYGNPFGVLEYSPTEPGAKTLVVNVVLTPNPPDRILSNGVVVQMFGVSLLTSLGQGFTTAYLPFTSRIFLEADTLLIGANVRLTQFFHRSLPFPLETGVPYAARDKILSNGELFEVQKAATYSVINSEPSDSSNPNFRYIGPRLVTNVDYYNYRETTDPNINLPPDYPAPPPGDSDLVISKDKDGDNVYEVTTAGRLDSSTPPPSLAATGGTAAGVVQFTFAGGQLAPRTTYKRGQVVVSNGRIYEVVQDGVSPPDITVGLTQTEGEVAVLGTAAFNFIPSKILRDQLPYWKDDLVISNGNAYRITIGGTIKPNGVGTGLTSTDAASPEKKDGIVTFQRVGRPYSDTRTDASPYQVNDVVSANGRIYKVTAASTPAPAGSPTPTPGPIPSSTNPYDQQNSTIKYTDTTTIPNVITYQTVTFQLVIPQFQKYAEIDSDYAGVPLQESVVYDTGDTVVSNGSLYQVLFGGTMGPVKRGLTTRSTQTLGGLSFFYIGPFYKEVSTIHPFGDVPFPYSSFDYSFPYSLKWSPSDTITNHLSWFGRYGYYETHTDLELLTRITDSKDRTSTSATLPVSILPPIDARAALTTNISSPSNDRVVAAGTAVQITAESKDINGVVRLVQAVQFFVDGVPIYAPDVSFPYTTEEPNHWTPTVAGTYILNALAVDDKGNYSISPDIRVNVTDNQPFVRITTAGSNGPLNPFVMQSGQTILIQGVESGSGGDPSRVTTVSIYSDGNVIGSAIPGQDGRFGFPFTPTNASTRPINYQLTARVLDINGTTASSNTIYIQVAVAPLNAPTPAPSPGSTPSPTPIPTATPSGPITGKLANISTRGPVEFGSAVMIGGFIVQGDGSKTIVARGIGPSLTALGVVGALQDPTISVHDSNGNQLEFNDDYSHAPASERTTLAGAGLVPTDGREAAIVRTIGPGNYTIVLQGKSDGVGLLEVYDLFGDSGSRLMNISTRGKVEHGDNGALIGGFIIQGTTPQRVIVRAIGPSLKAAGVADALADPTLDLYQGSAKVFSNDNWKSTQETEIRNTGVPPSSGKEAAIVTILDPGSYSAVIRGKDDTTGVALAEVYQLDH
jgi:hypothetical protein